LKSKKNKKEKAALAIKRMDSKMENSTH
jgi:hypothetical protein